MIYLDFAAATPLDPEVLEYMLPFLGADFYNPSADYQAARAVRSRVNEARSTVAKILGAKPTEIIFTAGGTEANNLAIKGVMELYPKAKILISSIEHESVVEPAANYSYSLLPVAEDGRIDPALVKQAIDDDTVLVSVMYANNEIGTVEPIRRLALVVNEIRDRRREGGNKLPLLIHTDACQAGNYLDLHVNRLGVDLMTLNGGKIYGPKQSGALYVKAGTLLKPQIEGGGQESGLRSGTENVAAAVGFASALSKAQAIKDEESRRLSKLRDQLMSAISSEIKGVTVNGSTKFRLPNNLHVTFNGQDNERLLIGLDQKGIMAAAGSACSASKEESSHVVLALGLSDKEARSSLRFSLGRSTTEKDVKAVIDALKSLVI